MQTITTIGLDIAKSVFQVHGVDAGGQVIVRRQLKRRYVLTFFQKLSPCLVGIEACGSAHHWSRELQALGQPKCPSGATTEIVPAAGRGSRSGGPNTVDQDRPEALRFHVGWAASGPVAKSGVGFTAPRHATLERHKGEAANFQLVVDWNAAKLQRVVGLQCEWGRLR